MDYEIIRGETSLAAIAAEWENLYARAARFPFADSKSFMSWWHIRGKPTGRRLHIVIGRKAGKLVSLAPLVVTRRWGCRVLEWGGNELYDYCDMLADDDTPDERFWSVIRQSGHYDFGLLRDVHPQSVCKSALKTFAQEIGSSRAPQIRLTVPSSTARMQEVLSSSTRSYYRRTERKLLKIGPLRFEVCRGRPIPSHILKILLQQKTEWLRRNHKQSWMSDEASDGAALLYRIAETAADAGFLHLSWLECGGTVIATHLGFEHRGLLHWYIPTYAMEWGKYAPGRLLLLKLIEWSVDHGLSGVDFMRGEEHYKSHLANDHHQLTDFAFASSRIARLAGPWLIPLYARRQLRHSTNDSESDDLVSENA